MQHIVSWLPIFFKDLQKAAKIWILQECRRISAAFPGEVKVAISGIFKAIKQEEVT